MDKNEQWLKWAVELQALAQAGLYYAQDDYSRERYGRIREIAAEMVSFKTDISLEKVKDLFCCEFAPYFMEGVKIRYPGYCRELPPAKKQVEPAR